MTRAVRGIDQDVKLNKALWSLGQKMAELKVKLNKALWSLGQKMAELKA